MVDRQDKGFDGIIEPPGPFDTLGKWERYLARLQELKFRDPAMKAGQVRSARQMIERKKAALAKRGKGKTA
jgi:hypothetical protein